MRGRGDSGPPRIGRFLDPRQVEQRIDPAKYRVTRRKGIGFGPFRFRGSGLSSERTSIRINGWLTGLFRYLPSDLTFGWMADVNVWLLVKQAGSPTPD